MADYYRDLVYLFICALCVVGVTTATHCSSHVHVTLHWLLSYQGVWSISFSGGFILVALVVLGYHSLVSRGIRNRLCFSGVRGCQQPVESTSTVWQQCMWKVSGYHTDFSCFLSYPHYLSLFRWVENYGGKGATDTF